MEPQKTLNCQEKNIEKKNKARGITFPEFRLYHKATVIKTVWYLPKKQTHRSIEQNREPRNKPTHLWSFSSQKRKQEYGMEKR